MIYVENCLNLKKCKKCNINAKNAIFYNVYVKTATLNKTTTKSILNLSLKRFNFNQYMLRLYWFSHLLIFERNIFNNSYL